MKIKLAILEKDESYLSRIVAAFHTRYSDKFEIYSFTDPEIALDSLEGSKIDVFVAGEVFDIDPGLIPNKCGFAYFVDSAGLDMKNNQYVICKFQKAELIYKQILGIYSENAGNVSGLKSDDVSSTILAFASPCGGVGTSSIAAACAVYFAGKGLKTLYLNFEKYGSSDVFFSAEGQYDMSDIIYTLKSKKANLGMKLESCVKRDPRGVYFYSQSKIALDMLELNSDDFMRLVFELKLLGSYDYIILDMDFSLDKGTMQIFRQAHFITMVSDGTETANAKLLRAYQALSVMEDTAESPFINRMSLIYNKFSNKSGKPLSNVDIKNYGGAPRYEHAGIERILAQLSSMSMFEKYSKR